MMMGMPKSKVALSIFNPSSMFTGEKGRGVLTSIASGTTAAGLNALMVGSLGLLSVEAGALLVLNLFGGTLGYTLDILFAKRAFRLPGQSAEVEIAYTALGLRTRYLFRSFFRKQFLRYWITGIIDAMVSVAVIKATIAYMDRRGILKDFKYRDPLVATCVTIINFFLFVNILRFDWAYKDSEDPVFNMIVLMWMTLTVMMYALYKASRAPPPSSDK